MAHTWKLAIGLGLLGASLAAGCVVKEGDDDDNGGASGEGGTSGTGGTTGGTAGKGGSGGAAGKGGSAGSGTGGTTGGSAGSSTGGTGGSTGGTGGTSDGGMAGDTGGTGGSEIVATCDPPTGELDSTPYPTCEADPADDECQICIEENCCDKSKTCYGTEPYNVCGWGGPTEGKYAGRSEIGCFQECLSDLVEVAEGECLADDAETCAAECATTMCYEDAGAFALVGNATNELATCMQDSCAQDCFGAATCGN